MLAMAAPRDGCFLWLLKSEPYFVTYDHYLESLAIWKLN